MRARFAARACPTPIGVAFDAHPSMRARFAARACPTPIAGVGCRSAGRFGHGHVLRTVLLVLDETATGQALHPESRVAAVTGFAAGLGVRRAGRAARASAAAVGRGPAGARAAGARAAGARTARARTARARGIGAAGTAGAGGRRTARTVNVACGDVANGADAAVSVRGARVTVFVAAIRAALQPVIVFRVRHARTVIAAITGLRARFAFGYAVVVREAV